MTDDLSKFKNIGISASRQKLHRILMRIVIQWNLLNVWAGSHENLSTHFFLMRTYSHNLQSNDVNSSACCKFISRKIRKKTAKHSPNYVKWWWLELTFGLISQWLFSTLQHSNLPNLPGMIRDFKWMKFVLSQILVFQAHNLRIIPIMFVLFSN